MKLLQVGPYPPPLGGWSFHIQIFKKYLDKHNITNAVLDIGENRKQKGRDCLDVQHSFDYVKKIVSYNLKKYTIYPHCNGNAIPGLVLTLAAQGISLLFGKRCPVSFHAGVVQKAFEPGLTLQKILAWLVFTLSKVIICNSDDVKRCIVKIRVPSQKIYSIPCFSVQYVEHEYSMQPEELDFIKIHSPVLISYIFFREEYDPHTLFQAIRLLRRNLPDLGVFILGDKEQAEYFITDKGYADIRDNLFVTGQKDHDAFLSLVEQSDIVIRTPVSDGVCSSVMEALTLKVPVVGSDNGTRPNGVVLYQPGNVEDLVGKVICTLEHLDTVKKTLHHMEHRDAIQEEFDCLVSCSQK
ncbi:glycosyltransferase [Desulfogranum japonicum]|uniref:glycosyltransferase n=1 Tax=Desulfogranum japonicum TaxID=231447 RepID=UPI000407F589|nr:glycosyltransferase [Desulfogranum japonicum]